MLPSMASAGVVITPRTANNIGSEILLILMCSSAFTKLFTMLKRVVHFLQPGPKTSMLLTGVVAVFCIISGIGGFLLS